MNITTKRRCAVVFTIVAVTALYATAAWRVEQSRMQPRVYASCNLEHCIPHSATLNALR